MFEPISGDVFRYNDICNVYVLKAGERALLIDIGSGNILNDLHEIGVHTVEIAVVTHEHRDQCLGAKHFINNGIMVLAPQKAKAYLGKAEVRSFWDLHFPLQFSSTCYSVLTEGCDEIKCSLSAGDFINWEDFRLEVIDAAGHSPCQLAYLLHCPNGRILFCGDALYYGGRIWKGYTLDWDHSMDTGVIHALRALERLRMSGPSIIAPSHGRIIGNDTGTHLKRAMDRLETYAINRAFNFFCKAAGGSGAGNCLAADSSLKTPEVVGYRLSEHLWIQYNSYFLLSETKQCLMVDCGIHSIRRFIPQFLEMAGCASVDVVIPTHPHDDHVSYLNFLKENYGTRIWSLDILCDIVQTSWKYWHPWARWDDLHVDRTFSDGQQVHWNEYELTFHWYPGQTAFAMTVETVVDGRRVLFTGDNFYPMGIFGGTGGVMGVNRGRPSGYRYSSEKTLQIRPQWILAAHGHPFEYSEEEFKMRVEWTYALQESMDALTPEDTVFRNAQFDPHTMSVYPFINKTVGGDVIIWLLGEGVDDSLTEADFIWDLPLEFKIKKTNIDRYVFPDNGIFVCAGLNAAESLGVLPFILTVPANMQRGQYGLYVSHREELSMEAMFIVKIDY